MLQIAPEVIADLDAIGTGPTGSYIEKKPCSAPRDNRFRVENMRLPK